jgi:hypothetical protein
VETLLKKSKMIVICCVLCMYVHVFQLKKEIISFHCEKSLFILSLYQLINAEMEATNQVSKRYYENKTNSSSLLKMLSHKFIDHYLDYNNDEITKDVAIKIYITRHEIELFIIYSLVLCHKENE